MRPGFETVICNNHLGDHEIRSIVQSEIEGGVFLPDLPQQTVLEIQTMHRCYTAVMLGQGAVLLSGHPEYCPQPVWWLSRARPGAVPC